MKIFAKKLKGEKGFTLVEVLIVVAIIGVLIAAFMPNITAKYKAARIKADQLTVVKVQQSVDAYVAEKGANPADWDALINSGYLENDPNTTKQNKTGTFTLSGNTVSYTP